MKAVIQIKELYKKTTKVVIRSIENEEINRIVRLDIADGIYNHLLMNIKKEMLIEINNGIIVGFYNTINSNNVVIENVNKYDILKAITPIPLNRTEVINRYINLVGCSERTGRRHLNDAIENNHLKPINYNQVVSVN